MERHSVTIGKEQLRFAAAHFITYGGGASEALHGHNYRVEVTLEGGLDENSLVYDFLTLRERAVELLAELDHRTLIADSNPHQELRREEGCVWVRHGDRELRLPEDDVVLLPLRNTTAEALASHLAERLAHRLAAEGAENLLRIEVEVEEAPGQSARHVRRLDD